MMSENVDSQTSKSMSFLDRKDWLVLLTGGLVSSGTIGWFVYKDYNPQQHNTKAIMVVLASFAGGMGIYFTGSALVSMWRQSRDTEEPITSRSDPSDFIAENNERNLREMFSNFVFGLERKSTSEASEKTKCKGLNKEILSIITQESAEEPCKSEDINNRLNYFRSKISNIGLKLLIDNQMETSSNEDVDQKAKCKEEMISFINELKGDMLGAIDPLPLVRNIQSQLTGISDEKRRKVITIVQKDVKNMVTKLEKTLNEFFDSLCKIVNVAEFDQEHIVREGKQTLGNSLKDKSTTRLKIEMDQNCNIVEDSTKSKSQTPSCQSGQQPKFIYEANKQPLNTVSSPSMQGKKPLVQTSECYLPVMLNLESPSSTDIPFQSKEASKSDHQAFKKPQISYSGPPEKLTLNQEQTDCLNLLKFEI